MDHSGGRSRGGDARPGDSSGARSVEPPTTWTRGQLTELGLTRGDFTVALDRGWLVREGRGRYRVVVGKLRLRMELVLVRSPNAVFSHRTAAFAHGLKKREPAELEVIVPRTRSSPRGAKGHPRGRVQWAPVAGLPFTTVAQTLADLLDVWPARAVAETIDARFPTMDSRAAVLADARRLPARHANRVLPLLAWAPENRRSKIEGQLARAVQMRGWTVRLNVTIGPYMWDIYIVEANLVVEFDSVRFHTDEEVFRVDRARQNNLVRRDVTILRYTDYDLEHRFEHVVDEICDEAAHALGAPRSPSRWDAKHCRDIYFNLEVENGWRYR
ncbi:DUF559 domain-containing protein [Corynebacterium hansenii]|uniref:DUF559 domain-containing protein n=1 Tax=Corynebacterium hansenii TaxID=394964 RepID=A0ABV7ZSY6_9CORY|nr:DUF559 domain-containing protein [Corynebacterium hansenii]WJZ01080.1 hypothetical protein CHAN_12480 [Corynebacterium hansenii]